MVPLKEHLPGAAGGTLVASIVAVMLAQGDSSNTDRLLVQAGIDGADKARKIAELESEMYELERAAKDRERRVHELELIVGSLRQTGIDRGQRIDMLYQQILDNAVRTGTARHPQSGD